MEARRNAALTKGETRDEQLSFSLAMFEHGCDYKHIYWALVGGRDGMIALSELRRVLSEMVKKDQSGVRDDGALPRDVRMVVRTSSGPRF